MSPTTLADEAGPVGALLRQPIPDARARTGDWMTVNHIVGQTELDSELSHFILEQFTQRFYEA